MVSVSLSCLCDVKRGIVIVALCWVRDGKRQCLVSVLCVSSGSGFVVFRDGHWFRFVVCSGFVLVACKRQWAGLRATVSVSGPKARSTLWTAGGGH